MDMTIANPANAMMSGMAMAMEWQKMRNQNNTAAAGYREATQNELWNNALRAYGAGFLSGDPNAVSALYGQNPKKAYDWQMDIEKNARDRDAYEREQDRADVGLQIDMKRFEMEVADWEKKASDEEKALAQAEAERATKMIAMASTPELWAKVVMMNAETVEGMGMDPEEVAGNMQFREVLLGQFMTIEQVIESGKPPKPADDYERYVREEEAAGRIPLGRIDFEVAKKGTSTEVIYGPDGTPILERTTGDPDGPPKLTVDAAKNTGFLGRMNESHKTITNMEQAGTMFWMKQSEDLPMGLGNYLQTDEYQQFAQARRDFVNAILRRESGAVISDEEFANADKQYFPQPGDSEAVIEQKRRNRETAIEGIRVGAGDGAAYIENRMSEPEQVPVQPPQQEPAPEQSGAFSEDDMKMVTHVLGAAPTPSQIEEMQKVMETTPGLSPMGAAAFLKYGG